MGHLFLDIETYSVENNKDSSINPYLPGAKVLVIAYNYYPEFKPPEKNKIKSPTFLKEWDSDEKKILSEFYLFLKEIMNNDAYVKITGFNILKFDLPYLFGRMKVLNITSDIELYNMLFRPFSIDLFQLSSVISEKTKKYGQLWGINHKKVSEFFRLIIKEGDGLRCSKYYDDKEFDKIIKYCIEEFNFEQLLDAFYLHILKLNTPSDNQLRKN